MGARAMSFGKKELMKCIGNTIEARQNGEFPPKSYSQHDSITGIQDKINALEERREIEAAEREVWEEHD
jgi:hypothetical protein